MRKMIVAAAGLVLAAGVVTAGSSVASAATAPVPAGEQAACVATLAYHADRSEAAAVRALRLIWLSHPTGKYAKYFKSDLGDYVLTGTYYSYVRDDCTS